MDKKEKNTKLIIRRVIVVIIAIILLSLIIWGISKIISAIFSKEKAFGNLSNIGLVISDGSTVYYNKFDNGIFKVKGGNEEQITDENAHSITMYKNKLYYLNQSNTNTIDLISVNTNGEEYQKIKTLSTYLEKFYIENDYVYYSKADSDSRGIARISLDNLEESIIVSANIKDFVVDRGTIYYVDNVNFLHSVDTSGQNSKDITRQHNISKIQVMNKWIYFYDSKQDALYKIKKDGSSDTEVTDLVTNDTFNITSKYIYYYDKANNQICRCKLNGKNSKPIVSLDTTYTTAINIANNTMYYLDNGVDNQYQMYRVKTNGKAAKDIVY